MDREFSFPEAPVFYNSIVPMERKIISKRALSLC